MKVAFFELEQWEQEYVKQKFSDHELIFIDTHLEQKDTDKIKDCQAIAIFIYSSVDRPVLKMLPNLKLVATMSTGFNHIDIVACKEQAVQVCNVPSYGVNTVAEHAMGLLLSIAKRIP